ncbi:MAG: M14 family zinc carboxypeptidase [Bacteroidota bacterium]
MRLNFLFVLQFICLSCYSQIFSPDQFLGYPLGSKFTYHWQLVNYYEYVAKTLPDRVKLIQYGTSYEGKPLLTAFVSSKKNIENLDLIRLNNLRLANMTRDKMAPDEESPVIVWLSYNVHGNEASSSEASMSTLYRLLQEGNKNNNEWLNETIVVLDPCLNPDGRDRYVQWFHSVMGISQNPVKMAREHHEIWPGGRTNHYYFDLNRDWAWQTQKETKQRIQLYNQWMPQVHVDYHEQGINEPYYFAPAAEPYHEVITPWQRSFQDSIGRNHAQYFDRNGWLFFTKLRFDLLYPSYGDTYPTYNGAIGMTYEQAGIGAGLAVITEEGDTLSLKDRINHHVATAMSTIETSFKNRANLIKEYRVFFNKAINTGFGNYGAYVIKKRKGDDQRIADLLDLMDKNGIRYGSITGTFTGYDYVNAKETSFSVSNEDIVISSLQPKSALIQVLMDPNPRLSDSITYDITAWSLPYVYGLQAYAVKNKISVQSYIKPELSNFPKKEAYGYVIKWEGVKSVSVASALLSKGVLVRYNETPFATEGQQFERGSLIILNAGNQLLSKTLDQLVYGVCDSIGVRVFPVKSGLVDKGGDFGSDLIHKMHPKRVVVLSGPNISSYALGAIWHFFEQELNYPITLSYADDFTNADLDKTDILILPDGYYSILSDKSSSEYLHQWIQKGGRLIAMESAVASLSKLDWGLKAKKTDDPDDKKDTQSLLKTYEQREREFMKSITPGSIFKVSIDPSHPLAFGYQDTYFTLKQNDQIYDFISGNGWNVGVIKSDAQKAGFVGSLLKNKLEDGLLIGVQNIGKGSVVSFTDDIIFRNFWQNGKLMLCNAVFFDF